jgi:2-oxoglutarate ferredoxin oxidoreductase subunit alpha
MEISILFAGDSGDGIQLLGNLFGTSVAMSHFYLNTYPEFPAEIRAPIGTLDGISSFKISIATQENYTIADELDLFVCLNLASFHKYRHKLQANTHILYDPNGFDNKNQKLSGIDLSEFERCTQPKTAIQAFDLLKNSEILNQKNIDIKERGLNKNFLFLGFLLQSLNLEHVHIQNMLEKALAQNKKFTQTSLDAFQIGINLAEHVEFSLSIKTQGKSLLEGIYRNINGNTAISLAIMSIPEVFGHKVVFSGYPITPASDIMHELIAKNVEGVQAHQAEDEIAAAGIALGAGFAGEVGITASSGPGISLKQEMINLAVMAELPLMILNIMRAGPSTGMPTKTEQSDLNLALFGRHGESPLPIMAIESPVSAYDQILDATKIMLEFQTPIIILSDTTIANSSSPWKIPDIQKRTYSIEKGNSMKRNENYVKPWVEVGNPNGIQILGGLEKDFYTGKISYDPENHQLMTRVRADKINAIAKQIPPQKISFSSQKTATLLLTWGSNSSVCHKLQEELEAQGKYVDLMVLQWIQPLATDTLTRLATYDKIYLVELNSGQLFRYLKSFGDFPITPILKNTGEPFFMQELKDKIDV